MADKVVERAAEIKTGLDAARAADDAAMEQEAAVLSAKLSQIVSGVTNALRAQTSFTVQMEPDFDEFEATIGWVHIGAFVDVFGKVKVEPLISVQACIAEGVWEHTVDARGGRVAYLAGQVFELAEAASEQATIALVVDVIIETLAHWIADGLRVVPQE